jgi:hypothetical protein
MAAELIKCSLLSFRTWSESLTQRDLTPLEKLEAYIEFYTGFAADGTRICPMGSLSSDWETLPKKVKKQVPEIIQTHLDFLVSLLTDGRKARIFSTKIKVEEQAQFLIALIQGSLQTLRVQRSSEKFRSMMDIAKSVLLA